MESRRILKVLANGWEVPYPDEVIYRGMLLLKDYRLNDYPENDANNSMGYDSYVEWLQEYLVRCQIELTEEQCKVRDQISTDKSLDGLLLGDHAGFYESVQNLYRAYDFPEDFEATLDIDHVAGIVYDDPYADYLELHKEDSEEPKPSRLEFILQDYGRLLLMKSEAAQFERYWPDFVKLEPMHWMFGMLETNLEPADSGWRVYLSLILKSRHAKADRIKELNRFFDEYADAIHK